MTPKTDENICHICKKPKDAIGSKYCSYPHPVSRKELND